MALLSVIRRWRFREGLAIREIARWTRLSRDTIKMYLTSRSQGAAPVLDNLLKAEAAEREVRSVKYQMKAARFPAYRDLAGFDFNQNTVNEVLERSLHRDDLSDDTRRKANACGVAQRKNAAR